MEKKKDIKEAVAITFMGLRNSEAGEESFNFNLYTTFSFTIVQLNTWYENNL